MLIRRITKPTWEGTSIGYGFAARSSPILHIGPDSLGSYLRRLKLASEVFPNIAYTLEGFIRLPDRIEVVTTQDCIPGQIIADMIPDAGKKAVHEMLDHWFQKRGFVKLYLSQQVGPSYAWYRSEDNLALFDAKPANLIVWGRQLFPIDVVPVRPTDRLLERILAAR